MWTWCNPNSKCIDIACCFDKNVQYLPKPACLKCLKFQSEWSVYRSERMSERSVGRGPHCNLLRKIFRHVWKIFRILLLSSQSCKITKDHTTPSYDEQIIANTQYSKNMCRCFEWWSKLKMKSTQKYAKCRFVWAWTIDLPFVDGVVFAVCIFPLCLCYNKNKKCSKCKISRQGIGYFR